MKKKLILCILFCSAIVLNSIEPKDYQSMTDHDRISLAVSYYEVFLKWKDEAGKKGDEAESYLKEAYKIEPEVDKYYRGELEIPEKTISFNWDEIFPEEESDEDSVNDLESEYTDDVTNDDVTNDDVTNDDVTNDDVTNDDVTNDDVWNEIVKVINEQNFEGLEVYFNDVIDIAGTDMRITRDELSETLQDWLSAENTVFPEYTTFFVNENVLKVTLKSVPENFFLPISSDTFYVIFSNGLVTGFSESE